MCMVSLSYGWWSALPNHSGGTRRDELHDCSLKSKPSVDVNVNVTYTISWQGHHDRVMQLNLLYFCGICQMMRLKVWPNTAQGCSHQSILMPQLQLLRYPMYYSVEKLEARALCSDRSLIVYWPPFRIRTWAAGFKIINGGHQTLSTAHE